MYSTITIGGKDYRLEYSIEASLYADCTAKLVEFLSAAYGSSEISKNIRKVDEEKRAVALRSVVREGLQAVANIPDVALTLFYAGLLQYHGIEGDKTVVSMRDAKKVVREYFEEHKDDDQGDFYSILQICIEQMGEDDFFRRIGLEKMFGTMSNEKKPVPMKKKQTAGAEAEV